MSSPPPSYQSRPPPSFVDSTDNPYHPQLLSPRPTQGVRNVSAPSQDMHARYLSEPTSLVTPSGSPCQAGIFPRAPAERRVGELGSIEAAPTIRGSRAPSLSIKLPPRLERKLNPTNYVCLSRKSSLREKKLFSSTSIKGTFTVNPSLHIPQALLGRRPSASLLNLPQQRKNLSLEVHNGGINVDIVLVSDGTDTGPRVTFDLTVRGGQHRKFPLIARLHTPISPRCSYLLTAKAIDGYTAYYLPPNFTGPITVTVASGDLNDHIRLSKAFLTRSHILSETEFTRSFFVGQLDGWASDEQNWHGDMIEIDVNRGLVCLQFIGETRWDGIWQIIWKTLNK